MNALGQVSRVALTTSLSLNLVVSVQAAGNSPLLLQANCCSKRALRLMAIGCTGHRPGCLAPATDAAEAPFDCSRCSFSGRAVNTPHRWRQCLVKTKAQFN